MQTKKLSLPSLEKVPTHPVKLDLTVNEYSDSDLSQEATVLPKSTPLRPSTKINIGNTDKRKCNKRKIERPVDICQNKISGMTKTIKPPKVVCFSDNKIIGRWDASGLHNKNTNYNDIIDKKYGKKPSGAELACRKFGKPSKNHSFTTDVVFENVLIHLYKSNLLSETDKKMVRKVHPLFDHLAKIMNKTLNIDFSSIAENDYNWNSQEKVPDEMNQKFLAAAIYYDFRTFFKIR